MSKVKQFFCTHYYETTDTGLPLYCLFTKKTIWPVGDFLRQAKYDLDAHTCLNCGAKFFEVMSRNSDMLLTSPLDMKDDWFIGKPMIIMPKDKRL